jgi:hypothetical protein
MGSNSSPTGRRSSLNGASARSCDWVIGCASYMVHLLPFEKPGQVSGEICGAIVREQPRPMTHPDRFQPSLVQCQLQGLFNVLRLHTAGEPTGNDVAGVIVQDGGQVIPAPVVEDLELGEVRLPQLMYSPCGLFELVAGRHHLEDRALDQVKALQDAIYAGFRDEIAPNDR